MPKYVFLGRAVYFLLKPLQWTILKYTPIRAYVMIECAGEVLFVKNWLGSGKWSFPGGGVHRGESPNRGACREVFEEIGLTLTPKDIRRLVAGFTKYLFGGKKFVIFRTSLSVKPHIVICSELTDYFWARPDDIKNLKVTNEVSRALAKALAE